MAESPQDDLPGPGRAINDLSDAVARYREAKAAFDADQSSGGPLALDLDDAYATIGPAFDALARSVGRPPLTPGSFDLLEAAELALSVAAAFTF